MKKIEIKVRNEDCNYSILIGNNILNILPKKIKLLCPKAQKIGLVIDKIFQAKLKLKLRFC